jgi:hypothetical protein
MVRHACRVLLPIFALASRVFGQEIKIEVMSAFVWGEDSPAGATSSTIQDPLTGYAVHKLTYGPIEVSSRVGFEGINVDELGTFLNYTITIVNSTDTTVLVRYGGISVDGRAVSLPWVVLPGKKLNKREHTRKTNMVELEKMQCFVSGFVSADHLFSPDSASQTLTVPPKAALTVSSVVRDPRSYSIRCSVEGCYPIGTIRYYLTVDSQDYVFVWPGRAAIYCGK